MATATSLLKSLIVPPASGQAPTATLIFAHGLGDSGAGWLDVAQLLSRRPALRHVRFVLPNAPVQPVTLNMGMSMPSWFDIHSLDDFEEHEDEAGLKKSAAAIGALVKAEVDGTAEGLNGRGVPVERVVVGGFSQGGAISYLYGLTASPSPAGIIGLSTWLPLHRKLPQLVSTTAKDIPVFHGHGSRDPIVHYKYGQRSVEYLRGEAGVGMGEQRSASGGGKMRGVRFETYKGMPHSACPEEIEHVGQWLERVVPE
ncbi:Phospholipase/carboxylesterase [Jaminaea rosea]|uniref:Acyl-protein thioesterase 1 n=1 Tax=Jaminaea rosea TaxID=1569628 RepID=A0A316UGZ4_9BASI|nr:Phospholipase/carboxylesterase [Jaminaea rosea]PWN24516.1 Phospholipase/carboxylesterase [Jaminaea rosea]